MIRTLLLSIFLLVSFFSGAQENRSLDTLEFDDFSLKGYYGYATALSGDYLLVIGGSIEAAETDYLLRDVPNTELILINQREETVMQYNVWALPFEIAEQMSSCHLQYLQEDSLLYLLGGFGYSEGNNGIITFPNLIVMDVDEVISALVHSENPARFIRQMCDDRLCVMDGHLEKAGETFFLLEGKEAYKIRSAEDDNFYYVQSFDNQIRTFKIKEQANELVLTDYHCWTDPDAFNEHFGASILSTILRNNEYRFKDWPQ